MYAILALIFLLPTTMNAQDSLIRYSSDAPYSCGILIGNSFIFNRSSIEVIPGATDCGIYEVGTSSGVLFGLQGEYAIIPSYMSISARLFLAQQNASLQYDNTNGEVLHPSIPNRYDPLIIRNQYSIQLDRAILDIGASIYPITDIPFFLRFGGFLGIGRTENTYVRNQTIVSPDYVGFTSSNNKEKVIEKGEVRSNTTFGGTASIGYQLSLTPLISIMPELAYSQTVNSLLQNENWKANSLEARIGLSFRPLNEYAVPPSPPPAPPIEIPKEIPPPPAIAIINPIQFSRLDAPDLELQQTVITQTFPILPYIFFDSSSIIPNQILTAYDPEYAEETVSSNTLDTYHNIISIIAKRMISQPKAELILTGSSDGKERPTSQLRKSLSLQRAQAIKDIFVQNWNIQSSRIQVKSRDLPDNLSNKDYIEGDAENRRVEIESNYSEILNPVVYSKFNEFIPLQNVMKLGVETDSQTTISSWTINIQHHGQTLREIKGMSQPPSILTIPLDSSIISGIGNNVITSKDSVDILFTSYTSVGDTFVTITSRPIRKTNNTFEISRLSLIVFEYDESSLSEKNKSMMNEFLKKEITSTSKIEIIGSTDKLGEAKYNLELSEERARTVEQFMKSVQPDIHITTVKGIGASRMLFDNTLPEGRYYCRTVSIEVKNPIQSLLGK